MWWNLLAAFLCGAVSTISLIIFGGYLIDRKESKEATAENIAKLREPDYEDGLIKDMTERFRHAKRTANKGGLK